MREPARSVHPKTERHRIVWAYMPLVAGIPAKETCGGSSAVVYAGPTEYSAKPLLWLTAVTRSPTRNLW